MPNESEPKGWWHTLPGILTAVAAVLTAVTGLLVAIRNMDPSRAPTPAQATPAALAPQAAVPANPVQAPPSTGPLPTKARPEPSLHAGLDVSGTWRDNFGNVTTFRQEGASVRFEGYGKACAGNSYRSRGSGTISGNQFRSRYESTVPPTGHCVGLIDDMGTRITSTCTDSVCGTFVAAADKVR
jgi:hypothetical protein